MSSASPAAWPSRSLTALKPSRSTAQTTVRRPPAAASTASGSRSISVRRLGMPVSGSVAASVRWVLMSRTWRSCAAQELAEAIVQMRVNAPMTATKNAPEVVRPDIAGATT